MVMVFPVLALPNPVHTVPAAPQPILPPLPTIYPPPPGLALLPDTDRPNSLMGPSISPPTVPAAPTRRSPCEHVVRVPSSFGYSALRIPDEPYSMLINSDHAMIMGEVNLTSSEVAALLHVADAAWRTTIDHLARANAATPLNVNPDGSPLTYRTATHGEESKK